MSAEEARQLSKAWRQYNKASRGAATDLVVGFAASSTGVRIYTRPTDSLTLPDHLAVINNLADAG